MENKQTILCRATGQHGEHLGYIVAASVNEAWSQHGPILHGHGTTRSHEGIIDTKKSIKDELSFVVSSLETFQSEKEKQKRIQQALALLEKSDQTQIENMEKRIKELQEMQKEQ